MSVETGDIVSRVYAGFRGADFRGEEINLIRSPDCLNVWRDRKFTESIRTRPGMKLHTAFSDKIYGLFFFNGYMIVHSGTKLYKVANKAKTELKSGVEARESNGFIYDNKWYFKDGKNYLVYDGESFSDVVGFIPTTSIGRKPSGGGTVYQDVNLLSDYRINTFLADGKEIDLNGAPFIDGSTDFYLDSEYIDEGFIKFEIYDYDKMEFVEDTRCTVDTRAGKVRFNGPIILAPKTDGQDNVRITYKKHIEGYRELILNCTMLQMFDNRVFFSGNPNYQSTVWHCSLNDPSYCSDLDYYREGMDDAAIKGMVAGNNALWVFREPSEANTNVFYHTPTIDDQYGKIYPSSHSSITLGCVGKAINFNDDIIFFSDRGMEGISGDITTEQVAAHRSSLVDRKLISDAEYKNMVLEEWEGYLLIFVGNKVFLADSRTAFTNENHIEYEFFYWELDRAVTCARVYDGILYMGTKDGIYTMTSKTEDGKYTVTSDPTDNITSYWVTPIDKFKVPHKLKTTNKRGCVVEATGDIDLYAKLEDTEFELIGSYKNVTDYFVSRIKLKKFKDLQLKFYSETGFSLETATMEVFVGGYIKR